MTREEREDAIKFFEDVAKKEVGNAKYSSLAIKALEQDCDTCEVGNPCLYCKHEFEPQESEGQA